MLSDKQEGIKYYFLSLWYDDVELNPALADHCWSGKKTLLTFKETNKKHLTLEDMDVTKKWKH